MAIDPLTLPAGPLSFFLKEYFLSYPDITDFFYDHIYAYKRIDQTVIATPSISIYRSRDTHEKSHLGYLTGELDLDIILPPNLTRDEIDERSAYFSQLLFLYLNATDLIDFLSSRMGGVQEVANKQKWDYSKSPGLEDTNQVDTYNMKGKISYTINLLNYYNSLQSLQGVFDETTVFVETPNEI